MHTHLLVYYNYDMYAGGMAKPPAKRSKFKEERMKKKRSAAPDQHELMEGKRKEKILIPLCMCEYTFVQIRIRTSPRYSLKYR